MFKVHCKTGGMRLLRAPEFALSGCCLTIPRTLRGTVQRKRKPRFSLLVRSYRSYQLSLFGSTNREMGKAKERKSRRSLVKIGRRRRPIRRLIVRALPKTVPMCQQNPKPPRVPHPQLSPPRTPEEGRGNDFAARDQEGSGTTLPLLNLRSGWCEILYACNEQPTFTDVPRRFFCIWQLPNLLPMDDIVKTLGEIYEGARIPNTFHLRAPAKLSRHFRFSQASSRRDASFYYSVRAPRPSECFTFPNQLETLMILIILNRNLVKEEVAA